MRRRTNRDINVPRRGSQYLHSCHNLHIHLQTIRKHSPDRHGPVMRLRQRFRCETPRNGAGDLRAHKPKCKSCTLSGKYGLEAVRRSRNRDACRSSSCFSWLQSIGSLAVFHTRSSLSSVQKLRTSHHMHTRESYFSPTRKYFDKERLRVSCTIFESSD